MSDEPEWTDCDEYGHTWNATRQFCIYCGMTPEQVEAQDARRDSA